MLGKLFYRIVSAFIRFPLVYTAILTVCAVLFYFGIRTIHVDDNIYSIFPKGKEYSAFSKILKENNFNRQIIFSVAPGDYDPEELKLLIDSVAKTVQAKTNGLIKDVVVSRESQEESVLEHLYTNLPALIDDDYYAYIDQKIRPDSIDECVKRVYSRLTSGSALFMQDFFAKDPLGISYRYLNSINPGESGSMQLQDGLLYTANGERVLFLATLNFESGDNARNEELNERLIQVKKDIDRRYKQLDFDYFGTFQIAYENSQQIKKDTSNTLYISLGLILLILVAYYRSILTPIFFVLPGIFGGLTGLAVAGFLNPSISAISIATSSVLMGIIINYSFHFFTHLKHSGSLEATIKELSFPMIVGSFTTVAAFAALLFTDSVILQDFGLIALFSLTGAALFTLLLLPPFIHFTRFRFKTAATDHTERSWFPKWVAKAGIFLILALTVVFTFYSNRMAFDDDLNNLGFHSKELVKKEDLFTGINPKLEKKIHLFSSGKSRNEALEVNADLFHRLQAYKAEKGLEEILSCATFCLSDQQLEKGFSRWHAYWSEKSPQVIEQVRQSADRNGLSAEAFSPFEQWITDTAVPKASSELLNETGLSSLLYERNGEWTVVTSIVVKRTQLSDFKAEFAHLDHVFLMDVTDMANAILSSVQKDFNYLLLFSALVVFCSLLLIYGRIELALFSFFPMVVSWIWILGISGIFGIEFNFVNIVIATFIFGLGDDFSIFVSDGLIQKLKYNTNALSSYRTAIILSAITTIIGTGALVFAKHPAIHSISVISVVGIGCVLVVTLLIQPAVFNFFIFKRIAKKLHPITFFNFVRTFLLYTYFIIGCTHLNAILIPLLILPIKKTTKRRILNYCVSKLAKSTIYLGLHIRKKIIGRELLDFSKPKIIVANHGSFLDILLTIMLHPKVIIVVKEWVYRSPFFGFFIRYSGYLFVAEGLENNLKTVKERVDEGYSVVVFPEGSRSPDGTIKRFHKGAFYLSEQLQLDIQPILILGAYEVVSKNDFIIRDGTIVLKILPVIPCNSASYSENYSQKAKEITRYMRSEFELLKVTEANAGFLWPRIFSNFVYKGPVLEWYLRIKWKFEKQNYELYDALIGDRKTITDIGCGYGFLDYYLHYRNPERSITAIDYDEDKIAIARNGCDKTEQLQFVTGDLRQTDTSGSNVVILNDVLHYLPFEEQMTVLRKIAGNLTENGLIILRDGISDLHDRHKKTKLTELFSTKLLKFNKTSNSLHFFSSQDIRDFAKEQGLSFEMTEQSDKTSNVLFILTKNSEYGA